MEALGADGAGPGSSGSSRLEEDGGSPAAGSPQDFDPLGALPRVAETAASGGLANEPAAGNLLAAPASQQLRDLLI